MKDMYESILQTSEEFRKDMVDFACRLIQTKSISGQEKEVAQLYHDEMVKLGYDEVFIDNVGNVIGMIKGDGPVVMYNSHMDHVGEGDLSNWEGYDPYGAQIDVCDVDSRDGISKEMAECIHGRAASDVKGGAAVQVYSGGIIVKLKKMGYKFKGTYMFTGVVHEETSEALGMKYMVDHTFKEKKIDYDVLVSSEATALNLFLGHRGRTEFLITTKGRTSHGSVPWKGINAIYKAMPIIAMIKDELAPSLPSDPQLGKSSVSLNIISCLPGALSIVPDECMLSIDRRTIPGENNEQVLRQFQYCIDKIAATDPEFKAEVKIKSAVEKTYTGLELHEVKDVLPWKTPVDHSFTKACISGLEEIGQNPSLAYWDFATDMSLNCGRDHKPCIGYSPMQEQYAHTPYDKVRTDFMYEALNGNVAIFLACCESKEDIKTLVYPEAKELKKDKISPIVLADYMVPEKFRTVEREQYDEPFGITEYPVAIDLSEKTQELLNEITKGNKQILGFARKHGKMNDIFETIERVFIEPYKDEYLITFVNKKEHDTAYCISESEIINLLTYCMHVL